MNIKKWFTQKYSNVQYYFKRKSYYSPKNRKEETKENISPNGKYKLIISSYETKAGCWNYSRGQVYRTSDGKLLADVKCNYASFWFNWIEAHPNGHDYLFCCENYQGQTVVELDTGKRVNYLPKEAEQGFGFCWTSVTPNPSKTLMTVAGCYWACPYEYAFYDFSNPMKLPYKELGRMDILGDADFDEGEVNPFFTGWQGDHRFLLTCSENYLKADGRATEGMSCEEMAQLLGPNWEKYQELTSYREKTRSTWTIDPNGLVHNEIYYKKEDKTIVESILKDGIIYCTYREFHYLDAPTDKSFKLKTTKGDKDCEWAYKCKIYNEKEKSTEYIIFTSQESAHAWMAKKLKTLGGAMS